MIQLMVGTVLLSELLFLLAEEGNALLRLGGVCLVVVWCNILIGRATMASMLNGALLGIPFILFSWMRGEEVHTGCGIIFILTGAALGWLGNLLLIVISQLIYMLWNRLMNLTNHKEVYGEACCLGHILLAYLPAIHLQNVIMKYWEMKGLL